MIQKCLGCDESSYSPTELKDCPHCGKRFRENLPLGKVFEVEFRYTKANGEEVSYGGLTSEILEDAIETILQQQYGPEHLKNRW